jgi:hypothetical protein
MAWHAHVLVVANVTATSEALLAALKARAERGPITLTLLMPAAGLGEPARKAGAERLEAALQTWREAGLEATGVVGDSDPVHAVLETWDPRRHDEIIVSTLPGASSRWLRFDFPHRVAQLTGALVTHVVAAEARPQPVGGPAPEHVREPLGPLAVLSWGGRR